MRVVGMGGSAGGLEAFDQFFSHMPPDSGLAFVLVPHLDPTHKGLMSELLQRHTTMKVVQVEDGMRVRPNSVYVIPPNRDMSILHGQLQLLEPHMPRGLRLPIDFFFRHLAADQRDRAVCVLVSGMGTDGTLGLRAIKEHGGLVMVQDARSAGYDGMPRSAIDTGMVDIVAPAADLPAKLMQCLIRDGTGRPQSLEPPEPPDPHALGTMQKIFSLLRVRCGNDFSYYKRNTIRRRIDRRMAVHRVDTLSRYARLVQEQPQELDLLFRELLIGVTRFFRDPAAFDALKARTIPHLLGPNRQSVRVWAPGCSTGEEAYSLAIAIRERLRELNDRRMANLAVQIFATDIDHDAVARARTGVFPANIAADVSPERLELFFVHEGDGFRVRKDIRDGIVFAPQNVLADPPFTKMDVICCRNLLIYLNADAQQRLLPLFHYALNPGGILMLGASESVGRATDLFASLDNKWKIFRRKQPDTRVPVELPSAVMRRGANQVADAEKKSQQTALRVDPSEAVQRALMGTFAPPAVVVNPQGDILYVTGHTGKFLEPAAGKLNWNAFAMARDGLRQELGVAVHSAIRQKKETVVRGVRVKINGGHTLINLTVRPLGETGGLQNTFLVVFEEAAPAGTGRGGRRAAAPAPRTGTAADLHKELRQTQDQLQSTVEAMDAAHEELRSANEELQSNNEELQSTNEELTTAKEELESLNEEMLTVNSELQSKVDELSQTNNDMKNLLDAVDIATIFLDNDLNIKRFTAQTTNIINLMPVDVGRPLSHIASNLRYDRLVADAREVLTALIPREVEVQTADDRWYNMRVMPYLTSDNVIEGVVVTFADVTVLKQAEGSAQESRAFAEGIIATVQEPLVVLDGDLRIVSANRSFCALSDISPDQAERRLLYELGPAGCRLWEIPDLRRLLEDILPKKTQFDGFRVEQEFPKIGRRTILLNARQLERRHTGTRLILLAMNDVT